MLLYFMFHGSGSIHMSHSTNLNPVGNADPGSGRSLASSMPNVYVFALLEYESEKDSMSKYPTFVKEVVSGQVFTMSQVSQTILVPRSPGLSMTVSVTVPAETG